MQGNDTEPPGGSFVNMSNTLLIFHSYKWKGVGGIMVSIAAFQAVDPGSIPGRRTSFLAWDHFDILKDKFFYECILSHFIAQIWWKSLSFKRFFWEKNISNAYVWVKIGWEEWLRDT